MPAGNVVRWRWGIDEQGNRVQESNARIIKWSDGSTQLLIGNRVTLDVVTRPVKDHHSVFAKLGAGVIEQQTVVSESLHLRPTGDTRRAFNRHQTAIKAQREAAKKIRKVVIRAPIDEKADEKLRERQWKARQDLKTAARQQQESTGLTSDFLEQDSDTGSDTDEEAERVRRSRLQASKANPAADTDASSDESDVDMSDEDDDDAGSGGSQADTGAEAAADAGGEAAEAAAAGLPKKKRARVAIDSSSEDEDED